MMAGNPSWWSMHSNISSSTTSSDHHHQVTVAPNIILSQIHPSTFLPFNSSLAHDHHAHDFPHSWSQLLMRGVANEEEDRFNLSLFQPTRGMNNNLSDVKQEVATPKPNNNNLFVYNHEDLEQEQGVSNWQATWSHPMPTSSLKSCVTSLNSINNNYNNNSCNNDSNTILDFTICKRLLRGDIHQQSDHSNSECNSSTSGGVANKKPKVQSSSTPPLKVRKEKLGDRITALHQLVSPFGKTDTASVLLEAIGYIRFLQGQIEALSTPYLGNNDALIRNRNAEEKDAGRDLKSRGLCVAPLSCTQLMSSDNGADYWATSFAGGF